MAERIEERRKVEGGIWIVWLDPRATRVWPVRDLYPREWEVTITKAAV